MLKFQKPDINTPTPPPPPAGPTYQATPTITTVRKKRKYQVTMALNITWVIFGLNRGLLYDSVWTGNKIKYPFAEAVTHNLNMQ